VLVGPGSAAKPDQLRFPGNCPRTISPESLICETRAKSKSKLRWRWKHRLTLTGWSARP
jgi:hypothetical protein